MTSYSNCSGQLERLKRPAASSTFDHAAEKICWNGGSVSPRLKFLRRGQPLLHTFSISALNAVINMHGLLSMLKLNDQVKSAASNNHLIPNSAQNPAQVKWYCQTPGRSYIWLFVETWNLQCLLFQPLSSHMQLACPKTAQKRRSDQEVCHLRKSKSNACWNS